MIIINSLDNKRVKELVRLRKTNFRKEKDVFVIDGKREIEMALKAGIIIKELYYCPELIKGGINKINQTSLNLIEVSERVLKAICYKERPDGFLALAQRSSLKLENIKLSDNPLLIILESVEKPGNIGAILRTAYAVGVDAVIINDNKTDIYNPNIIRASEGHLFTNQIAICSHKETLQYLKNNKISSFAAATSGSKDYTRVSFKGATAIVLGSESEGLSKDWLKETNQLIKIPMQKGIDSLNVSVSAAVILFEALRQRK